MADDDDVDMSLFLTAEMEKGSAMLIDIELRLVSKGEAKRRQISDGDSPHGGGCF
jgi:hypothetical protein